MTRIVIIGAGQAAGRAAEALREGRHQGSITLIGEEPHAPYERPSLSKELLTDGDDQRIVWVRPLSWYAESSIDLRLSSRAVGIDRSGKRVWCADGSSLPYDDLILATGSRPRPLPIDHPNCLTLRTIEDGKRIAASLSPGKHVVVIGAGFIGLEVAAAARGHGCEVTVYEQADRPMARGVPAEIGHFYADLHRRQGVELHTGCQSFDLSRADLVVVGIGVVPNCELAAEAGLAVDNGLLVDQFGRSSDPAIYGAGDVTNHFNPLLGQHVRLESWQNAQNQAIAVARNILGAVQPYAEIPWFWSDQYGRNLQIAGGPNAADFSLTRGELGDGPSLSFYFRGERLVGLIGIDSGRDMRFAREILAMAVQADPAALADTSVKLADLYKSLKAGATAA